MMSSLGADMVWFFLNLPVYLGRNNMNNILSQIAVSTAAALALSVALAQQAQAITFNFSWQGDAGYSATGTFGYDETTAPTIISESGAGPTNYLDFLTVSFFDPSNNPLQSFNTVSNGVSESPFFTFNFDTTTQQLFGDFDIAGGTGVIGEQFFSGTIGTFLELRQDIDQISQSFQLDQNSGEITVIPVAVTPVPEPTSVFGLLALTGLGAASVIKKKQKI